jgi:hypothetical protein
VPRGFGSHSAELIPAAPAALVCLFQICGTAVDETAPPLVGGLDSILLCCLQLELLHMTDMKKKKKKRKKEKEKE